LRRRGCNYLWFSDNRLVLLLDGFELLGVVLLHELGTRRLRGNHHCRGLELLCLLVDGFCRRSRVDYFRRRCVLRWDDRDDGGDLVCRFVDCRFRGIACFFVDRPWCFGWFRFY